MFSDPSGTLKSQRNGGVVQFPGDPRNSSLGWIATGAAATSSSSPSSLSSPSTGTLRRGSLHRTSSPVTVMATATNERQPLAVGQDRGGRWDNASMRPFSYTNHQQSLPQALLRQQPSQARDQPFSELNGAAIKETLMMSSSHIPESCV